MSPYKLTEIMKYLNDYTTKMVSKLGRVISITGTAYDDDYDGKHSSTPSQS